VVLHPLLLSVPASLSSSSCSSDGLAPGYSSPPEGKDPLAFFSPAWYAGLVGRMHLNAVAFRPHGSALYGLPSLLNHSCAPTLAVAFAGARAAFAAARDLRPLEELTLAYGRAADFAGGGGGGGPHRRGEGRRRAGGGGTSSPSSSPQAALEEHLRWNYGFECAKSCNCGRYTPSSPPP